MPDRVQVDVDGTIFTFPINPSEYDSKDSEQHTLADTIDGGAIRFTPFFDSRKRVMRWKRIPNKSPYDTLIPNLRSAIGVADVKIRHRDLDLTGSQTEWRQIRVEDVSYKFNSASNSSGGAASTGRLSFDLSFVFTYLHEAIS